MTKFYVVHVAFFTQQMHDLLGMTPERTGSWEGRFSRQDLFPQGLLVTRRAPTVVKAFGLLAVA